MEYYITGYGKTCTFINIIVYLKFKVFFYYLNIIEHHG